MKTKSRIDLLRQAMAAPVEVTDSLEVSRLCDAMGRQANDELARRINEAQMARRVADEERKAKLIAQYEERRRAEAEAEAAAQVEATERQRQRDDDEEKQAHARIVATGMKPIPVFSHPR